MSKQHTPGPWSITADRDEIIIYAKSGKGAPICFSSSARPLDEMQANMNLIAAAPETAAERDSLKAELREARIFISNLGMERDELLEAAGMLVRYASQVAYDENVLSQLVEQLGEIIDKANGKTKG